MKTTRVLHAGPAEDAPSAFSPGESRGPQAPAAQTPSQAIVQQANEIIRVQDARGRTIGFRILNWIDRANFSKILGADSDNDAYRNEVLPAYLCVEIEGRMLGRPPSTRDLLGRMAVLGDEGQAAIQAELVRRFARRGKQELTDAIEILAKRFAPDGAEEEMAAMLLAAAEPYVADEEEGAAEDDLKNAARTPV